MLSEISQKDTLYDSIFAVLRLITLWRQSRMEVTRSYREEECRILIITKLGENPWCFIVLFYLFIFENFPKTKI